MMQKVQRWSQPFWICTKAAHGPRCLDQVQRGLARRHDIVDADFFSAPSRTMPVRAVRQNAALIFCALPTTLATSGMLAKVCGSVCAAQPVTTIFAAGRSRLSRRIGLAACRTASAVTRAGVDHERCPRALPRTRRCGSTSDS